MMRSPRRAFAIVAAILAALVAGSCTYPRVTGTIKLEEAGVSLPCVVERHDPGYADGRSVGTLKVVSGQPFEGVLVDPSRGPLAPASEEQWIEVKCPGYSTYKRTFKRRASRTIDLGVVTLQRVRPS
jgi:hypothetical protein